ncbi:MAG: hypothetical protein HYT27_03810 [Parcubacteria group bacterium]|nr:hypothetical protein [Parcubacteria group bacterium]
MRYSIQKITLQISIIGTFLLAIGLSAHAQLPSDINITVTPGETRAREEILVKLESFSINLSAANISWGVNGKTMSEGLGRTTFSFTAGPLGSVSRVQVVVQTSAGEQIERNFQIRPAGVDLISEASTYTPAFYKGAALASSKSKVKIVAIPHFILENGRRVSPQGLLYTWEQDRKILGSLSGIGKETILIDAPRLFEETRVSVVASSQDGLFKARNTVLISPRDPEILFYEKHPTEGVRYNITLGPEVSLSQEEITIRAEPYFFSTEDLSSGRASFAWSLNNNEALPSKRVNEITLGKEAGAGVAQLTLEIQNAAKILQEAVASLLIRF